MFWNGPLGAYEINEFADGTVDIARTMALAHWRGAFTVVGGGDTVAAVRKAEVLETEISHVSTGGGASLKFIGAKSCQESLCSARHPNNLWRTSQRGISMKKINVAVNGYGVIGKRVADAVTDIPQDNMELIGVCLHVGTATIARQNCDRASGSMCMHRCLRKFRTCATPASL